jgi:hypothetical protein
LAIIFPHRVPPLLGAPSAFLHTPPGRLQSEL